MNVEYFRDLRMSPQAHMARLLKTLVENGNKESIVVFGRQGEPCQISA